MKSEYICISCRNNKQDERIKKAIQDGYDLQHIKCACGVYSIVKSDYKSFSEKWAEIKKEWLNKK